MKVNKQAIKEKLIYQVQPISDSIKRGAKDDFLIRLQEIIDIIIQNSGANAWEREELLNYLQPTISDLIQKHNSR